MIYEIISGALMMGCLIIGLFFWKFWQKTHDRLFIMFASAFWMLALERLVLGYLGTEQEISPKIYFIRLTSFVLILIAIVNKNREAEK